MGQIRQEFPSIEEVLDVAEREGCDREEFRKLLQTREYGGVKVFGQDMTLYRHIKRARPLAGPFGVYSYAMKYNSEKKSAVLSDLKRKRNRQTWLLPALAVLTTILLCYIPEVPDGSLFWCTRFALVKIATLAAGWYAYRTLGEADKLDDKIKELEK